MVILRQQIDLLSKPADLKILQFNTLADAFAGPHFLNVIDSKWETRKGKILNAILSAEPDVACLEEVDHFDDFFLPLLKEKGYNGVWIKKPQDSSRDGLALFYKTNKLTLTKQHVFTYEGQNQLGIISTFDLSDSRRVCVCVTHLKAKSQFAEVRVKEVEQLKKELLIHAGGIPTIICGDFNDVPKSICYAKMIEEGLYASSYSQVTGSEPPFTTFKDYADGEKKRTIDYIFYTQSSLDLVSVLELIPESSLPNKLPCKDWPSDHLSLQASFAFKNSPRLPMAGLLAVIDEYEQSGIMRIEQWINGKSMDAYKILQSYSTQQPKSMNRIASISVLLNTIYSIRSEILTSYEMNPEHMCMLTKRLQQNMDLVANSWEDLDVEISKAVRLATMPQIAGHCILDAVPALGFVNNLYTSDQLQKYGEELIETCNEIARQIAYSIMGQEVPKRTKPIVDNGITWKRVDGKWKGMESDSLRHILHTNKIKEEKYCGKKKECKSRSLAGSASM